MGKDREPLEWCIKKYISKWKCAYPEKPVPSEEKIEEYIKFQWSRESHIVYPVGGPAWNQIEFDEAYQRGEEYNSPPCPQHPPKFNKEDFKRKRGEMLKKGNMTIIKNGQRAEHKGQYWYNKLKIKLQKLPITPEKEAFFQQLEQGKYGVRPDVAWDTIDTGFSACCSADCPKKETCRCWLLFEYIARRELIGHTITVGDPNGCSSYKIL